MAKGSEGGGAAEVASIRSFRERLGELDSTWASSLFKYKKGDSPLLYPSLSNIRDSPLVYARADLADSLFFHS